MKRVLTFLAIMLLPLSVMAMTPVTDSDLADVTGQAGVSINADLTMDINIGTMAWGDDDGIGTSCENPWTSTYGVGGGGYIGISGFKIDNLNIKARTNSADTYNAYTTMLLKPITIDVATAEKNGVADVTFVRFGLGALEIHLDGMQFDVGLATASDFNTNYELNQTMGRVTLGGMDIYINPFSYVDIYAHTGCGVNFDLAITVDHFAMAYASWGDTDGLPSGNMAWMSGAGNAGYIGVNNFVLGDGVHPAVTIDGGISVDIATATSGVYSYIYSLLTAMDGASPYININDRDQLSYLFNLMVASGIDLNNGSNVISFLSGYLAGQGHPVALTYEDLPLTVVHISFPKDFTLEVARMTGDIVLGSTDNFAAGTYKELGNVNFEGLHLEIKKSSWVDVWAH